MSIEFDENDFEKDEDFFSVEARSKRTGRSLHINNTLRAIFRTKEYNLEVVCDPQNENRVVFVKKYDNYYYRAWGMKKQEAVPSHLITGCGQLVDSMDMPLSTTVFVEANGLQTQNTPLPTSKNGIITGCGQVVSLQDVPIMSCFPIFPHGELVVKFKYVDTNMFNYAQSFKTGSFCAYDCNGKLSNMYHFLMNQLCVMVDDYKKEGPNTLGINFLDDNSLQIFIGKKYSDLLKIYGKPYKCTYMGKNFTGTIVEQKNDILKQIKHKLAKDSSKCSVNPKVREKIVNTYSPIVSEDLKEGITLEKVKEYFANEYPDKYNLDKEEDIFDKLNLHHIPQSQDEDKTQ